MGNALGGLPIIGPAIKGVEHLVSRPGDLWNKPGQMFGELAGAAAPFVGGGLGTALGLGGALAGGGGGGAGGGAAGGGNAFGNLMDPALKAYILQKMLSGGGLDSLFGKPNDQGQLGEAQKIAGAPAAVPGQDLMEGFASTGGVNLGGSTDPYDLLPHEQAELSQGIDNINAQKQAAVGQHLQDLIKRGLDPKTAELVAAKLNQHYENEITKHRTGFMETARKNRQNTYAGLIPQLSQLTGLGMAQKGQDFGQRMDLAQSHMGADAARQSNIRTILGQAMSGGFKGYTPGGGYVPPGGGSAPTWGMPGQTGGVGGPIYGPTQGQGGPIQPPEFDMGGISWNPDIGIPSGQAPQSDMQNWNFNFPF